MDESTVTFRYKDYKQKGKRKTMTLEGSEFIRRFLLHVLPKGFCKIRYYGLLSVRQRSGKLKQCMRVLGIAQRKSRFEGMNWQQVMKLITGKDVTRCPCCKEGTMTISGIIGPQRSPPR